jgi:RNA polymerase sigma factor (sigma-70 family)
MVLGVCRRFLSNGHDAEDAFQATFLLLVRKAAGLRDQELVGNWLYGVACRVARRARATGVRREVQAEVRDMAIAEPETESVGSEARHLIDEELQRLPRKYRAPVVLCYLQGQTNEAAAQKLRCPAGTIKTRLSRARDILRDRLARRGLALSIAGLTAALAPESARAVPGPLAETTLRAAMLWASGQTVGAVSAPVAGLVEGTAAEIVRAKLQTAFVLAAFALVGTGAGLWAYLASASGQPATAVAEPESSVLQLDDSGLAASVQQRVHAWQPTQAERRFDEIGWAGDLRAALRLARESNRPVFVVSTSGRIETGRASASATNLRASAFSNDRVIELLNGCFVPVYVANADYAASGPAPLEEKDQLRRIRRQAVDAGLGDSSNFTWILSADGTLLTALDGCHAALADRLVGLLEEHSQDIAEGKTLVAPAPQSRPPAQGPHDLLLHLTCRYLERQGSACVLPKLDLGRSTNYFCRGCPAENWAVWPRQQWNSLLPRGGAKLGDTWAVDPQATAPLFRLIYPPTEDNDLSRNRIDQSTLTATIVALDNGIARARLDGSLRMKHRFAPERDDNKFVEASLTGFVDFDTRQPAICALKLVSTRASYGKHDFGVALRLQR